MKWLAAVWRFLVVVWSRAVDELALRRPCAPCPPFTTHPRSLEVPHTPSTLLASLSLSFFQPFQRPSLLYLFFFTIITLPGMSAASPASLAEPPLPVLLFAAPFYNCFPRYLSILFTMDAFARPLKWRNFPARLKPHWIMRQTSTDTA